MVAENDANKSPARKKSDEMMSDKSTQVILLALFGLFIVIPMSFLGTMYFYVYFGNNAVMGYLGGFSIMMFLGGLMGYFTVLIKQSVQEVQIKVIKEE